MHMNCVFIEICLHFLPKLSKYWPHLSFRTNVHKGDMKHNQPCLFLKAFLVIMYPMTVWLVINNTFGEPTHTIATTTLTEQGSDNMND